MSVSNDFLARLRAATSGIHDQLEKLPISFSLLSENVSENDLATYLSTILPVHRETEDIVFKAVGAVVPDLADRRKTASILDGLERLGADRTTVTPTYLDACWQPTPAFNIGMLYVTEGSVLGGKFILKHLSGSGLTTLPAAAGFFDVYGNETGAKWKLFVAVFSAYAHELDERGRDTIIAGAVYAFERITRLFEQIPQQHYENQ